jgi:hypothetical protein
MKLEELKKLAEGENLKYFVAPDAPTLLMNIGGFNGTHQIVIPLELDGRFLQFRTVGYLSCPADDPHLEAVLRVLGQLDYQLRVTKFGWDPNDGEIVGYADMWLEDSKVTQQQFSGTIHTFFAGIDLNKPRIAKTIETGTDPGEFDPNDLRRNGSGLPPALKGVVDRLAGTKPGDGPEGPTEV